jgi:competence ComEA-like helix-hairpin-helix protein
VAIGRNRWLLLLTFSSSISASNFQPVNLNAASKEQIMVLPGVGEKLAQRIVEHRSEKGQFASLDDLLVVKGFKPKLLSELSGKIELTKVKKGIVTKIVKEAPKPKTESEIRDQIAVLEKEPKLSEIQQQAMRYATADPERVEEWFKRARTAPALPSMSLSAGTGFDSQAGTREKSGDAGVLSRRSGNDFNFSVKMEWKLGNLFFNRDELSVARESFRKAVIRERVLHDVMKSYVERKKARIKVLTSESLSPMERIELDLFVEEQTAILDGLTGGWFGEMLAKL